ncbi:hypothetical protein BC833DRAFT_595714 [Globomyces pollinis-pini]|nr:hypothetical protein BC833DRAFT_595714 [Globomyces pollinis-pini]
MTIELDFSFFVHKLHLYMNNKFESFEFSSKSSVFSNLSNLFKRKKKPEPSSPTPSVSSLDSDVWSDTRSDGAASPSLTSINKAESLDGIEPNGLRDILGWRNDSSTSLFVIRRVRSTGIQKDYWMRDEKVKECYDCKAPFNTFRRRHHCRICGQIFCHRCAASIVSGDRFGYQGDMRVCDFCLKVVDDYKPVLPIGNSEPLLLSSSYTPPMEVLNSSNNTSKANLRSVTPDQSSMDNFKKILGPTFFRNEEANVHNEPVKKSTAPFRKVQPEVDDLDPELTPYMTDEEYSNFLGRNEMTPKSFVKRIDRAMSPAEVDTLSGMDSRNRNSIDRRKSPSLVGRRKFSTRSLHRYGSNINIPTSETIVEDSFNMPRHFRSVSSALNVEINAASVNHVRLLMRQMLEQASVSNQPQWEDVIIKMLLNVCNQLGPDVRNGDEIDIRHYVKIKKIPGGLISDSHYVNGVVASKKVIHKKMLDPLKNPRILLLTFPLEYQRVENQFVSLEPLIAQEKDHLENLVGRVIALKPDVVMVEKTVGRIALELLLDANIVVIPSVKLNVLSAVARCTKADVVHSIDKLSAQKMGTCGRFQFKTFIHSDIPGVRKTFLYVEGCPETLGCTLVLRGATFKELKALKEIVDFLVFVVYSLKLETCLFQDQYALTPTILVNAESPGDSIETIKNENLTPISRAIRLFETIILSGSPNVQYPIPYLLQKLRDSDHNGTQSFRLSQTFTDRNNSKTGDNQETVDLEVSNSVQLLIDSAESLSPFTQQSIIVLFSNICKSNPVPCSPPQAHVIEYYRDSDLTLGQFIEDTCFGSKFLCPLKNCGNSMLLHYRTYAHGDGKLNVTVDSLPCPVEGMGDRILMWSLCKICRETTPFVPMSEETWKYSFGKYLELTFHHTRLGCRASSCSHDIHREHMRYFSFRDLTIRFEYESIILHEVSCPPMRRKPKTETIVRLRQLDMETITNQILEFYDSILKRISNFTYDIVPQAKVQACKEALTELSKKCTMEKKFMIQLLHQNFIASSLTDAVALNSVYKSLLEKVTAWDAEFSSFIRTHVQGDARDIRRMTAVQIKRMFADKDVVDAKSSISSSIPNEVVRMEYHPDIPLEKFTSPVLSSSPPVHTVEDMEFTPVLKRRLSIELIRPSTLIRLPKVMYSPSMSAAISVLPSPPVEEPITQQEDELPLPRVLFDDEDLEDKPDGFMYPRQFFNRSVSRPKSVRVNSTGSSSVTPSIHIGVSGRQPSAEDDLKSEWNTITGVAAETRTEEPRFESPANSESRPTSIMKTITNLWTGNPANFLPLVYPSNPTEHIFPDSLIIVREDEPSSIISFALSSAPYQEKLQAMRSGNSEAVPSQENLEDSNGKFSIGFDDNPFDIEETLLRETGTHIRYQFWDGPTRLHCKIYFAEQFDALRRNCGVGDIFEQSLARCLKWDASGGKSGTFFMKTRDDWLVVKRLSQIEVEALISFSPAYFEYMSQAFFHELPTVLAKIFGFYHIGFKNPTTRKSMKMDILVMENLFYERHNISRIFDLKGSERNRHVQSTGKQMNKELLLTQVIYESPLFIREHSKKVLRASVYNDTLFLSKLNVMDYSLLVGIDSESNELVVGIVDFIRTFTWDKQLESWVKETGLLGGRGMEPTIVTPRQYKNRFREAMDKYFLMVPDKNMSTIESENPAKQDTKL